ncbi:MAG: hypothetical protein RLZZ15_2096, partial [Verrucomicrobiota bacterium]
MNPPPSPPPPAPVPAPVPVPGGTAPRGIYDLAAEDYPPWAGAPVRTLLLCSHPRSGSTLLGETLHAAGGWGCPLEYFHRGFQPAFAHRWGTPDFPAYLRAVYRHRTDPTGTLGVKLFWPDVEALVRTLQPDAAADFFAEPRSPLTAAQHQTIGAMLAALFPNPTFIHLGRHDAVRQAVSALIATQTQVWRRIPGVQDHAPTQAPQYDFARLRELLAHGEHCRESWE